LNEKIHKYRFRVYIVIAFIAGCLVAGVFLSGLRSSATGKLDKRYADQYRGATEIIGRLEDELGRERELNRQLREHNNRAREIADGLASASERNVRNLQDAIGLIGEIRAKLKVLAEFYNNSSSDSGTH
jgi:hypothetical protein